MRDPFPVPETGWKQILLSPMGFTLEVRARRTVLNKLHCEIPWDLKPNYFIGPILDILKTFLVVEFIFLAMALAHT